MSVEIAWKQNILVTDFHLLKSLLVVFGFGSQAFICGFSRQNINSVGKVNFHVLYYKSTVQSWFNIIKGPDHLARGFGDLMATLQTISLNLKHKIITFGGIMHNTNDFCWIPNVSLNQEWTVLFIWRLL